MSVNLDKITSALHEDNQTTTITFYADKEATLIIDKQAESVSGPPDIALIDLTLQSTSGSGRGLATIYKSLSSGISIHSTATAMLAWPPTNYPETLTAAGHSMM